MSDVDIDSEGRRLLRAASAGIAPSDDLLATFRAAQADQAARAPHRRRTRFALSLGTVAALGTGLFAAVTAFTATSAPSAYAAVTAATDATCSQSFRVTVTSVSSGQPASRITGSGEFDVPDGVAEESIGPWTGEVADGNEYLYVAKGGFVTSTHGKPWVGAALEMTTQRVRQLFMEGAGLSVPGFRLSPCSEKTWSDILGTAGFLKSAAVSGPGWTGTRYTFTAPKRGVLSAVAVVDQQGRFRYLGFDLAGSPAAADGPATTLSATFSDFGTPVAVKSPPAAEVYWLPKSELSGSG
jgi:hypothetical protein